MKTAKWRRIYDLKKYLEALNIGQIFNILAYLTVRMRGIGLTGRI